MTDEQIEQAAIDKFRELSTSMNNPPLFWFAEGVKIGYKMGVKEVCDQRAELARNVFENALKPSVDTPRTPVNNPKDDGY